MFVICTIVNFGRKTTFTTCTITIISIITYTIIRIIFTRRGNTFFVGIINLIIFRII